MNHEDTQAPNNNFDRRGRWARAHTPRDTRTSASLPVGHQAVAAAAGADGSLPRVLTLVVAAPVADGAEVDHLHLDSWQHQPTTQMWEALDQNLDNSPNTRGEITYTK